MNLELELRGVAKKNRARLRARIINISPPQITFPSATYADGKVFPAHDVQKALGFLLSLVDLDNDMITC